MMTGDKHFRIHIRAKSGRMYYHDFSAYKGVTPESAEAIAMDILTGTVAGSESPWVSVHGRVDGRDEPGFLAPSEVEFFCLSGLA